MRKLIFLIITTTILLVVIIPVAVIYLTKPFLPETRAKINPNPIYINVFNSKTQQTEIMELEEYLIGTVAAEMPVIFELEALKAQAVAARTYVLKRKELSQKEPNPHHPQAEICTDSVHCQAWASPKELKERWGLIQYFTYRKKISKAVQETQGIVITHQGKLIDPVYHSTSNGRTDNAGQVWKFDIPYLKTVESPWDLASTKYHGQISYTLAELAQKTSIPIAELSNSKELPFDVLETTDGGRIKKIKVGNQEYTGEEFRRLLKLNSATVTWKKEGDKVIFETLGYGHGVGMSQYGANGMAKEGKNYQEILTYYYTGVQLYRLTN